MPTPLPIIRGTSTALYPFTRTVKCNTLVSRSQNGTRQTSILAKPLVLFSITCQNLTEGNRDSLQGAMTSAKGMYATDRTLVHGNVTYSNMAYAADRFESSETRPLNYQSSLNVRQTLPQDLQPTTTLAADVSATDALFEVASVSGFSSYFVIGTEICFIEYTPDSTHFSVQRGMLGSTAASHSTGDTITWGAGFTNGSAFPTFPNGTRTQLNWQKNQQWKTDSVDLEAGVRSSYAWYGGRLANFPTSGLLQWIVGGDELTDAEAAALEAHFLANWGQMFSFTFNDPDSGTAYTNSYYTDDALVIEHIEPNKNKLWLKIESYEQGSGITSAILHCWTDYHQASGSAFERIVFDNGSSSTNITFSNTDHSLSEFTQSVSLPNGLAACNVSCFPYATLSEGTADVTMNIYDCWLEVTFADGTTANVRPTSYGLAINNGTITNPELAFDADTNPPTTFATNHCSAFGPLANPNILTLFNFSSEF